MTRQNRPATIVAAFAGGDVEVRVTRHDRTRTRYAVRIYSDGRPVGPVAVFRTQRCAEAEARAIARGADVAELGGQVVEA